LQIRIELFAQRLDRAGIGNEGGQFLHHVLDRFGIGHHDGTIGKKIGRIFFAHALLFIAISLTEQNVLENALHFDDFWFG
jgi:hypothetical protein